MRGSGTAVLFPGQGSQSVGMLAALAEASSLVKQTFEQASEVLAYDLWGICQQGPEALLNRTETTQPAMLAADIATWRVWTDRGGPEPAMFAGHSLGEYPALVAAGCMDFEDALRMVALRGKLMQSAVPEGAGAMAAVLGLEDEVLDEICQQASGQEVVACANFNAPGQVVIAGHLEAVERAAALAGERGAKRVLMLPVSVPAHSALMQPAAGELEAALRSIALHPPRIPVIQNADVRAHEDPAAIVDALVRQLWQPVQWTRTIGYMLDRGINRYLECGPGKVLAGLNRRISRESAVTALTDMVAIEAALEDSKS
jgi:[acyl-carrier-protein] S-malonyltransferase